MTTQLCMIVGSTREVRQADKVAAWFACRVARRDDVALTTVDLRELDLRQDLGDSPGRDVLLEALDRADAVVAVTPEYNHSFPGPLKTAFDSAKAQWRAKPIGFVSYGGVAGGARATEALRLVVAELHMVSVRTAVGIPIIRRAFDGDELREPDIPSDAADQMLDQLVWWASVLTPARSQRPYPG